METLPVPVPPTPSEYERQALREIQQWKQPTTGRFRKMVERVNNTLHDVTDLIRKVPGVDWTIDNVVSGLLQLTNEIMHDSVWREAIYKEYQKAGLNVAGPEDFRKLALEDIDRSVNGLNTKYRALTAAQGAAAGYAGVAGVLPDVLGLVALNLRAVGEYATYCGYDVSQPSERLYALQILNVVSQPSDETREEALVPVSSVSHSIARHQTVQTVEQVAVSGAIRGVAKALGARLTKVKLTQVLPMTGAFIGGGFNAYYTSKVCDAAFYLYRERWLIAKYGPDIVHDAADGP
ncbi:MAG: EcsC family protein [Rhodothermales bacterium]